MFVLTDIDTGARLCEDAKFRTFACFGTYPECVKVYRQRGWALRRQKDLFNFRLIDTEVKEIKDGQVMDATGSIVEWNSN